MKNKKGKKKYVEFDPEKYKKKQNNKSCSKENKEEKNISLTNSQKNKKTFKNCLENLYFLFPNFSSDVIEDVYHENNDNFSKTKIMLKEMSELDMNENNENQINENDMYVEEEQHKEKKRSNKKKKLVDISDYSNFEVVANDELIGNDEEKEVNIFEEESGEEKNIPKNEIKNNENNDYNNLLSMKEKGVKEYFSVFDNNNSMENIMNTPTIKDEPKIDDYLFEQNISFLCQCFPQYSKEVIVKKICDLNFDMNSVVSNILNETYKNDTKEEEKLNYLKNEEIDEILSNYENMEEVDFDDDFIKSQKTIEDLIKAENRNKIINLKNEEDYDMDKKEIDNQGENEYFLNKNIDEIQDPKIRNDLKKLISIFSNEDENNIKNVYYSFLNYKTTFDYFDNKDGTKNIALKVLINEKNHNYKESKIRTCKPKKKNNNLSEIEKRRNNTLKNILENKPINWNFQQEKNNNAKDLIVIRNRLYQEAKNFFANKKINQGLLMLSKARRYQQEMEQIANNKGMRQFFNNNAYNNSKQIDLHGLHVEESKSIINAKIAALRNKAIEDNLKSIDFTIITGIGSHSKGGKSVLFYELVDWLKAKERIKVKGVQNEGVIYITIY